MEIWIATWILRRRPVGVRVEVGVISVDCKVRVRLLVTVTVTVKVTVTVRGGKDPSIRVRVRAGVRVGILQMTSYYLSAPPCITMLLTLKSDTSTPTLRQIWIVTPNATVLQPATPTLTLALTLTRTRTLTLTLTLTLTYITDIKSRQFSRKG